MRLRCSAFAKVNRSLLVLGKRPDGYHELDTVFQSIGFSDELVFEPAPLFELRCGDASVPAGDENLVSRAALALERESGRASAVRVTLTKRIPVGGGLGGGSSDAAAALRGISTFLSLGLSEERLEALAASLGSDVPFFLAGGRARGTGRGERITPLPDLPEEAVLLLFPPFPLSTPAVFAALRAPALTAMPPASNMPASDPALVPDRNDLEPVAESFRVELRDLRRRLEAAGARSARLSGSGSTVFGVFGNLREAEAAAKRLGPFEDGTRAVAARTLNRAEYARRTSPQVV